MEEEKRKILTKEGVRRDRLDLLRMDVVLCCIVAPLVGGILIGITCGAYALVPGAWYIWGGLILLDAILAAVGLRFVVRLMREWYYISSGKFRIEEDKLVAVGEGEVVRQSRTGSYTVDMLYFENYGRIPEDKGTRGYGPCGSTFYLVVLDDPKHTLYTFYSSQLYCYKPEEEN